MKYGLFIPNSGPFASSGGILSVAERAESLGYDSVALHDHVSWDEEDKHHFLAGSSRAVEEHEKRGESVVDFYEAVTTLSYLASATDSLELVTGAAVLSWREPVMFAKQCATLHELSDGRLRLGVCIGNVESDFQATDTPFHRRGAITEETLDVMTRIFDDGRVEAYDGDSVTVRNGTFFPRPDDLPIWYAGESDPALRRVARYADGWLPLGSPEFFEERLPVLEGFLDEENRSLDEIEVGLLLKVAVADSAEAAREKLEYTRNEQIDLEELERHPELGDVYVSGTPDDVAARIGEYADAGVDHVLLSFISESQSEMIEDMERLRDAM